MTDELRRRKRVAPVRPAVIALAAMALAACTPEADVAGSGADRAFAGVRYLSGSGEASDGFARAVDPRPLSFPSDHASHPDFRTEWWYFTGNVFSERERHFGFELTLFRIALAPPGPPRRSTLAADTVWMAHLALTDTARRAFHTAERLSRGAAGIAGVRLDGDGPGSGLGIRVEDFSVLIAGETATLRAAGPDFGIALTLTGLDRIVAQGEDGLDAKGPEPGNASYYYSAPRLAVTGSIRPAGQAPLAVTGSAWMDREWSTSALSSDLAGWDWFALQLDDGRDLMFYRLRGRDGSTSAFSSGSITDASGDTLALHADDVVLAVTRRWRSPATGVRYPVAWHLAVPKAGLDLDICPRLDAQELDLSVRYWEGAVSVCAGAGDPPVGGVGYLELAGY